MQGRLLLLASLPEGPESARIPQPFYKPALTRARSRQIWSTHKWLCGKSHETFSQPPLTANEASQLSALHTKNDGGLQRPWNRLTQLRESEMWKGGVNVRLV